MPCKLRIKLLPASEGYNYGCAVLTDHQTMASDDSSAQGIAKGSGTWNGQGKGENNHEVDVEYLDMLITRGHSYICPITRRIINDPVYIEDDRWTKEIEKLSGFRGDNHISNEQINKLGQLSQLLADSYANEFRKGYFQRAIQAIAQVTAQIPSYEGNEEEQQKSLNKLKQLMHDNVDETWSDAAASGYKPSQEDVEYAKRVNRYTDSILKKIAKYFAGSVAGIAIAGDIGAAAGFGLGKAGTVISCK